MTKLVIDGPSRLEGPLRVSGAKNAALPILAASLLTSEECVFENVPNIHDVRSLIALLAELGSEVDYSAEDHVLRIQAHDVRKAAVSPELATKMRASFLVVGPLAGRLGRVMAPHPGGCAIGSRPVNVDIKGLAQMGSTVSIEGEYYSIRSAGRLSGARLYLDYPSHTGTENLMMAACLAKGTTVIKHASAEPEVAALADCLCAMGAKITGAGTSIIEIEGVDELHGVRYTVIPDRIEAGTFAIASAISQGDVTLAPVVLSHMDPLTHKLREVGVDVEESEGGYRVRGTAVMLPTEVQTLPYPGFPTDLQACFSTLLTQARGTSIVHERVYDRRLGYVSELEKMGATIRVNGQTAEIEGPSRLRGAEVTALDLRAGAALVLAALAAEGRTVINNVQQLERGYEDIVSRLTSLGASISWEE